MKKLKNLKYTVLIFTCLNISPRVYAEEIKPEQAVAVVTNIFAGIFSIAANPDDKENVANAGQMIVGSFASLIAQALKAGLLDDLGELQKMDQEKAAEIICQRLCKHGLAEDMGKGLVKFQEELFASFEEAFDSVAEVQ